MDIKDLKSQAFDLLKERDGIVNFYKQRLDRINKEINRLNQLIVQEQNKKEKNKNAKRKS